MPSNIQMSILPPSIVRSDDTVHDLAEQGKLPRKQAADSAIPARGWTAKQWLKAGIGAGVAALALTGTTAGVTYALSKSKDCKLPKIPTAFESASNAAEAPSGYRAALTPPPAAPARSARGWCAAPVLTQDTTFPATPDVSYPGTSSKKHVFLNGLPRTGEISAAATDSFPLAADYYPLLESLVALQPAFIAENIRDDGPDAQGNRLYSVRLFNRPDPLAAAPTEGWLQSGLGDFNLSNIAAWPRLYDHAMSRAHEAGIIAQHPEGAGDLLDVLSSYRDDGILLSGSPIESLFLNAARAKGISSNVSLFNDKDDNIPFMVEAMRTNPMLFGSLTFDFNQARPTENVTLPSNTTLSPNVLGLAVVPADHPAWQIESRIGGWATYAITGMHEMGINLRLVTDATDEPEKFLTYDAMASAADVLTLGRVYCGESPLVIA